MNQVIKPLVKQDLDKYVDLVDTATEALDVLDRSIEAQEQVDSGYGGDDELAQINTELEALRGQWLKQASECGHTNNRGSVEIPLSGTANLDSKKRDELSIEIKRAKAEITGLEKLFDIKAKSLRAAE
ncbi:MAG: hypothetical protein ABL930_04605 [Pseudobdellovibrio sp.]